MTPEIANELIMSFHKLRIRSVITPAERLKIWKRLITYIYHEGLIVEDDGFYKYKFTKVEIK